jgi:hypothetical protein
VEALLAVQKVEVVVEVRVVALQAVKEADLAVKEVDPAVLLAV